MKAIIGEYKNIVNWDQVFEIDYEPDANQRDDKYHVYIYGHSMYIEHGIVKRNKTEIYSGSIRACSMVIDGIISTIANDDSVTIFDVREFTRTQDFRMKVEAYEKSQKK